MVLGVLIGLRDHPRRRVRDAEVQDFALDHEVMQAIHHLFDAGIPVPPVNVQNVDVGRAQFLETGFDAGMHGLDVVSDVVRLLSDGVVSALVVGRVLNVGVNEWKETVNVKLAFVAITSCSRISRFSAHSPINISDVSSWLVRYP
jgi:hypothetical protein